MAKLTQGQTIVLGQVLERIIAPAFDRMKFTYDFSKSYDPILTRPDYLLKRDGCVVASMAVTCTQDQETMNKKRWRYIDEAFQLKSFYGCNLLFINCEFADQSAFKKSEVTVLDAFFDASIRVYDFPKGDVFLALAITAVKNAQVLNAEKIATGLIKDPLCVKITDEIAREVDVCIQDKATIVKKRLFYAVWRGESANFGKRLQAVKKSRFSVSESYMRYVVLSGLIAGHDVMAELFDATLSGKALTLRAKEACERSGFEISPKLTSSGKRQYVVTDDRLKKSLRYGFSFDIFTQIENVLLTHPAISYALQDIRNAERALKMAKHTLETLTHKEDLSENLYKAYEDDCYCGLAHNRVWLLDMIIVCLDVSTNELNKEFCQRYGRDVLSTMMEHYISKTDQGRVLFSRKETLRKFCDNMSLLVNDLLGGRSLPTAEMLAIKFADKVKKSIGNQPFANPMHRYFELVMWRHNIVYHKKGIQCLLSSIDGIPTSMKTVHEVYQAKINGKDYWFKIIAGYDGVKDKTREMAARAYLMKYSSKDEVRRSVCKVFVTDGKWDVPLQRLLTLAGWNCIVPALKLSDFLDSECKQANKKSVVLSKLSRKSDGEMLEAAENTKVYGKKR